jgi:hypothetical protein
MRDPNAQSILMVSPEFIAFPRARCDTQSLRDKARESDGQFEKTCHIQTFVIDSAVEITGA